MIPPEKTLMGFGLTVGSALQVDWISQYRDPSRSGRSSQTGVGLLGSPPSSGLTPLKSQRLVYQSSYRG
jgi:hypothetical protein